MKKYTNPKVVNKNQMNTRMVFILDRSGSMRNLASETIGGFNSMIENQKNKEGQATVTTILFDNKYEVLHDNVDIQKIALITEKEYFARGCTALLDAVGLTISKTQSDLTDTEKVIFVITTDGMENASKEYSYKSVKELIEEKKKLGWEFIFMGANIDSVKEGSKLGITPERSVNYHADADGVMSTYGAMNNAMSQMRRCGTIDEQWRDEADCDFNGRKKD